MCFAEGGRVVTRDEKFTVSGRKKKKSRLIEEKKDILGKSSIAGSYRQPILLWRGGRQGHFSLLKCYASVYVS